MKEWISTDKELPPEGKDVLINIIYQRYLDGFYAEDEIIISGFRLDDQWCVGNQMLLWDFDENLNLCADDVTHWMPLPEKPE